jgi:hypothetical protein
MQALVNTLVILVSIFSSLAFSSPSSEIPTIPWSKPINDVDTSSIFEIARKTQSSVMTLGWQGRAFKFHRIPAPFCSYAYANDGSARCFSDSQDASYGRVYIKIKPLIDYGQEPLALIRELEKLLLRVEESWILRAQGFVGKALYQAGKKGNLIYASLGNYQESGVPFISKRINSQPIEILCIEELSHDPENRLKKDCRFSEDSSFFDEKKFLKVFGISG